MTVHIREASLSDADTLSKNIRKEEEAEVLASQGVSPYQALEMSIQKSSEAYSLWYDDKLIAVFGVAPFSLLSQGACPWMLTTKWAKNYPRIYARYTKPFVQRWLDKYKELVNFVDARYEASVRWATWAGFTVESAQPYGLFRKPFHRISIRRK